jgi:Kef-type K+ transport system membrane component KefB
MFSGIAANFNIILTFGILLLSGYLAGRIANFFKFPKITGYITAGILLEPGFFGVIPSVFIDHSGIISNFALCVISYAIGGTLQYNKIKKMGNTLIIMTLFESVFTFLLVTAALYVAIPFMVKLMGINLNPVYFFPLALIAGALASPTDPTPTLAVKEEYKADGPVTTTILGIGAFDDALGIINFSLAIAVCAALLGSAGVTSLAQTILHPLSDIVFSILNGILFGCFLVFTAKHVKDKGVMVVLILGTLFSCYGLAQFFNFDELLSTMALGCLVSNSGKDEDKFFISIRDYFEEIVFVVFFVIAGAHLQLSVLIKCLWIVIVFVIARMAGKFSGAFTGATLSGADSNVRRYTALGLIPQGGIVVGLALLVKQNPAFTAFSSILLNIVLGTTVLFEFMGPLLTEIALKRTDEIGKLTQK